MTRIPRSTRSRGSASTASLCLALAASLTLVAGPARAGDVEEAKLHFEKAQTAYKLGQFDEAIREYEAAYRAMPDPAFLFNIAQSERQQYRLDKKPQRLHKSLSLYKSYLREMPKANNRETVQKLIEELHQLISAMETQQPEDKNKDRPARLVIRGESAEGGQVTLDGKLLGTVPLAREVEPGVHLVRVTKQGYKPYSTSVDVSGGSKIDLPVALEPVAGVQAKQGTPVYKTWWFWTIVGVAVAGGAGTGIYFATRGDDIPAMPEIDLR